MEDFIMKNENYSAVSPVVGVMLMLVVTIIIAAIVSGFAGGLIESDSQKAPSLSMDVSITNSGTYRDSGFHAKVTGVSEPIPTSDLKIITSWTTTVKTNTYIDVLHKDDATQWEEVDGAGCVLGLPLGTIYHGGAEVLPGVSNTRTDRTYTNGGGVAPFGSGTGVEGSVPVTKWSSYQKTAYFGNYALEQGTVLTAEPIGECKANDPVVGGYPGKGKIGGAFFYGGYGTNVMSEDRQLITSLFHYQSDGKINDPWSRYVYNVYTGDKTTPADIIADGGQVDNTQAVLGCGWENLRTGDTVNVKVIYIPSGKTIFDKDVTVSA
jgi:FlaG/FlaF family flagellin (archaellin)